MTETAVRTALPEPLERELRRMEVLTRLETIRAARRTTPRILTPRRRTP